MTWTLFNLQLFLTQLLQDLWTSAPRGTSFENLTTLVSLLCLQGTFYNLTPDKLISLLSFSTLFYILMNTVPPQIQATTNLGPSAPRPDWPLPVSLTISALLMLVLALGLVTVSPQDWPLILHLSVGIACIVSCVLLLGRYFLCTAELTDP